MTTKKSALVCWRGSPSTLDCVRATCKPDLNLSTTFLSGSGLHGFSRNLESHENGVDFAYNFIKIHRTLRMTPAMAAGVTDRLWDVADLVALWERYERRAERAA